MLSIAALSAVLFHAELQNLAETLCKDIPPASRLQNTILEFTPVSMGMGKGQEC